MDVAFSQPPTAVQACGEVPKRRLHTGQPSNSCPDSRISFLQLYFKFILDKAEPWLFRWLVGAFWAAVPCGVLAPVLWAVGLLPPPFLLANVEVGGCLFPSSFPIYYGCFVEDGLVDFGEFISIKPEGLPSLRASLLLRLLLQKTCGFSSSWLLTSFFYTQVTIPYVSFFSQASK
ncbi:hypothetical protein M5K25_008092 [Dendrobium thyrsiflorum]|uniref:Uncharacterized protein n=1 Tax=Dendrobium thyrsiflorum TaxID=117978 RepID=A0ABD0V8I9_DENTH